MSEANDWKTTLNLPQTAFPMKANLPDSEPKRLSEWKSRKLYARVREARKGKPRWILHDGPPYANGHIHLGHVVNKTLNVRALSRSLDEERAIVAAKRNLVEDAAIASGGIPRIFLQLMADAASYAKSRRTGNWPIVEDLTDACADQVDTFRRLLLPGDADAARTAAGTDGRDLDLSRKVRLMAHGSLLERVRDQVPVLELHPLAKLASERGGRHA